MLASLRLWQWFITQFIILLNIIRLIINFIFKQVEQSKFPEWLVKSLFKVGLLTPKKQQNIYIRNIYWHSPQPHIFLHLASLSTLEQNQIQIFYSTEQKVRGRSLCKIWMWIISSSTILFSSVKFYFSFSISLSNKN